MIEVDELEAIRHVIPVDFPRVAIDPSIALPFSFSARRGFPCPLWPRGILDAHGPYRPGARSEIQCIEPIGRLVPSMVWLALLTIGRSHWKIGFGKAAAATSSR